MHYRMRLLKSCYSFANDIIHTSLSQYEKEFGEFLNSFALSDNFILQWCLYFPINQEEKPSISVQDV